MVGITSFGGYLPFHRLSRDDIAKAWETRSSGGHKSVASYDEDSITMAVAAGLDSLKCINGQDIEGVLLGTTTAPYREKQGTVIIAIAIDCPHVIHTADITNSLRSGTTGINIALDAIESGRLKNTMVIASDCRLGAPRGEFESLLGDGAAALVFGNSDVVASIEGRFTVVNEILDVWRAEKDIYLRSWEERFTITQGYNKVMTRAVQGIMDKHGLLPQDFAKVILYAPDKRSHIAMAKTLGFDPETQLQDSLISNIGNTGTASSFIMLVAALEEAQPGDRLLLASYGDGSDAFILKVTENISKIKGQGGIKKYLQSETKAINYEKYLHWRGQIEVEPPRRLDRLAPSAPALYRERKQILALYGQRCRRCGTIQYPAQRICVQCQDRNNFDDYKLSDKKATVYTFAKDYATTLAYPPKIMCVIGINHCLF